MRRIAFVIAPLAAALGLAACGSSTSTNHSAHPAPSAAVSGDHNSADVMFAQMMTPHHRGAIDMTNLAPTRAASPQVKELAARISSERGPEITEMTGWLTSWNQPPADMAMIHPMPGMMSESDMTQLSAASGPAFDRQFLTMMTAHHQGAIEMAKTEQSNGIDAPAKALAGSINTGQTAEITKMQNLLKTI